MLFAFGMIMVLGFGAAVALAGALLVEGRIDRIAIVLDHGLIYCIFIVGKGSSHASCIFYVDRVRDWLGTTCHIRIDIPHVVAFRDSKQRSFSSSSLPSPMFTKKSI